MGKEIITQLHNKIPLKELSHLRNCHLIVHASFRSIRKAYGNISAEDYISRLKELITEAGSLIFPAFTYCFCRSNGDFKIFDRNNSLSLTGYLSEYFRTSEGVIRTSSPTHSFSLWGRAAKIIDYRNSPASPLGSGSVPDWMSQQNQSYIFMAGTDFSSLTFLHYLENISGAEYVKYSPWKHLSVLEKGISIDDEQELRQIPGCSKNFINFEKYLVKNNKVRYYFVNELKCCVISVKELLLNGLEFLSAYPEGLLCSAGTCEACDSRRLQSGIQKY